jgi:BirA family transcriptional regulator, biotin operon repressor / biotin---[acetyl-CoA-carboxylase] ligase
LNKASKLHTQTEDLAGFKILFVNETKSTNDLAKSLDKKTYDMPLIVRTNFQSAGRGQNAKTWESAPDQNLLCTISYPTELNVSEGLYRLNFMSILAVIHTLKHFGLNAYLKWPNDIMVEDKKICGILTETSIRGGFVNHVYSGIGLNVNEVFDKEMALIASSVYQLTGTKQEVSKVLEILVKEYAKLQFSSLGVNVKHLEEQLSAYLWNKGKNQPFLNLENNRVINAKPLMFKYNFELMIQIENEYKLINHSEFRWQV